MQTHLVRIGLFSWKIGFCGISPCGSWATEEEGCRPAVVLSRPGAGRADAGEEKDLPPSLRGGGPDPRDMMPRRVRVLTGVCIFMLGGCRGFFLSEGGGTATAPDSVPRVSFTLRAESGRCDLATVVVRRGGRAESGRCDLATVVVRRGGRAALVVLSVRSVGGRHIFLVPDLDIRRTVEEGKEEIIQFVADRSGIYDYGCATRSFLGPFAWRGKITVD